MRSCEEYKELCSASLDNELTKDEEKELFEHFSKCPECVAYLDDLTQIYKAWEDLKEPLPADLHEYIMKPVLQETQKDFKQTIKRPFPLFTVLSCVAACVIIFANGSISNMFDMNSNKSEFMYLPASSDDVNMPDSKEQKGRQRIVGSSENMQEKEVYKQIDDKIEEKENIALNNSFEIPSSLQTSNFAFCYVAVGKSEIPSIYDCELLENREGVYYFRVNGSISDFEKNISILHENDFETAMRDDLNVKIDSTSKYGLLIVALK